jgi:DNA-binding NtrC family response regulator
MPAALQAHLLRLLDRGGEYQRLGDARPRRADLRVVAATNRPAEALKHDFAARLTFRVTVPGLDDRPEDVPLLVDHLLAEIAARDEALIARFRAPGTGRFRVAAGLIDALVHHPFSTHVRELERILWQAAADSPDASLTLGPAVRAALAPAATGDPDPTPDPGPDAQTVDPGADAIRAALADAAGSVTAAARSLGLRNRFVLYRLMRKHGIVGS